MLTLYRLNAGYRVLYSAVLVFMTLGTAAHTLHQHVRVGITPAAVAAWYRGNEADTAATVLLFPRSFEEVIGDAWLAAATYALALVIFGAILLRSAAPAPLRAGLVAAYAAAAMAASAAPPLVRYGSAAFAWLASAAFLALPLLAAAMAVLCIAEMWGSREAGPRFDPARVV